MCRTEYTPGVGAEVWTVSHLRLHRAHPAEQRSGADRANGSFVACGYRPGRGGSPRAL